MAFENLKKDGIKTLLRLIKRDFLQIANAIRTVNGTGPDANGDVAVNEVPYAQNLVSESSQRNTASFIERMAGGDATLGDGSAWLMKIRGKAVHDGYVAEQIEMSCSNESLTVTIDRASFIAAFPESGTLVLTYSSSSGAWSEEPSDYGITVTGTPENSDIITVVYVAEERGEITVSNPQTLKATGWNLYDHTNGYAKLVKYAYGYRIEGTYTGLTWSATPSGSETPVTVTDGNFDIPADGYVHVSGGNATDTVIYATWEDWTEGCPEYAGYTESTVNLATVMAAKFPNGLLAVGDVYDEIDLNLGQVTSRIERMSYSEVNRAAAAATGRAYDFDDTYIYLEKAPADISPESVTIDGGFTATDHGIEFFTGTDVEVDADLLYGNNLKNKLERNTLTISSQTLTSAQKTQVQNNLGIDALISAITGDVKNLLVVETRLLFDNKTVAASEFASGTYTFSAKSGYTAIGIVGIDINNASSSGANSSYAAPSIYYLSSATAVYMRFRNYVNSQAKLKATAYILFRKNIS